SSRSLMSVPYGKSPRRASSTCFTSSSLMWCLVIDASQRVLYDVNELAVVTLWVFGEPLLLHDVVPTGVCALSVTEDAILLNLLWVHHSHDSPQWFDLGEINAMCEWTCETTGL